MNGTTPVTGIGVERSPRLGRLAFTVGQPVRLMSVLLVFAVVIAWAPAVPAARGAMLRPPVLNTTSQKPKPKPKPSPRPLPMKVVPVQPASPEKPPTDAPTKPDQKQAGEKETGKPAMKVEEKTYDFGVQWVGPALKHTFTITNNGDATLKITKIKPACGCTIAGNYPRELAPGASGKFPFLLDTKKVRGKFSKPITITSNDPVQPNFKLTLSGEVRRYVEVTPTTANFGRINGEEPQERVLTIKSNTENPLKITLPEATKDSKFTYTLTETAPGKVFELRVATVPPLTVGSLRDKLVLTTSVEQQKTVDIRVAATIPDRLEVQPKTLTLYAPRGKKGGKSDKPLSRLVRFTNYGKTPVKILEGTVDNPDIKVTIVERQEGKAYNIQLELPPNYEPPDKGNLLTLKTDDPQKPTLTVPIRKPMPRTAKKPQPRPAEQMVGKQAPTFDLTTTAGKKLSTAGMKDAVTVLDFFAPNCGYCKKQIPRMEKVRQEYEEKGVRFVLVSQTMRKPYTDEQVVDVISKLGSKAELVLDHGNTVGPLFKANSFPTMVLVGKTGKIEAVNVGNVGDLESRMKKQLDAMLAGKPVPKFASAAPPSRKRPAMELVGKPAPTFSFETLAGKTFSNVELAKHPATVLNFIAANCGFCKRQVPNVEKVRKEYEAKGVRFINVAQKMRKDYTVEQVVDVFKGVGSNLELAYDLQANKIGGLFKATSYPTMVVLGKSGKIEAVNIGAKKDLETVLKGQLDTLIAGKSLVKAKGPARPAGTLPVKIETIGLTRTTTPKGR